MEKDNKSEAVVAQSYPYRFALRSVAVFVCGVLLTSIAIWFYSYREPAPSYAENYEMLSRLGEEIVLISVIVYAAMSLLTLAGTAVISLLYSHKVAGPLYKLGLFLREVTSGDFSGSVKLRKNDVIHPLAEDINALVSSYRALVSDMEAKAGELSSTVSGIRDAAHSPSQEELHTASAHIAAKTDEIKALLQKFTL